MSKKIPFKGGGFAIVDDADYLELSRFTWHITSHGYAGRINTKHAKPSSVLMHRQIIAPPADLVVDHINGNRLDNRRENLRVCTTKENLRNRKSVSANNSTGFRGVYRGISRHRPWRAAIRVDGRLIALGIHQTPEDAARAYDTAARKYFGEFASPNFSEVLP